MLVILLFVFLNIVMGPAHPDGSRCEHFSTPVAVVRDPQKILVLEPADDKYNLTVMLSDASLLLRENIGGHNSRVVCFGVLGSGWQKKTRSIELSRKVRKESLDLFRGISANKHGVSSAHMQGRRTSEICVRKTTQRAFPNFKVQYEPLRPDIWNLLLPEIIKGCFQSVPRNPGLLTNLRKTHVGYGGIRGQSDKGEGADIKIPLLYPILLALIGSVFLYYFWGKLYFASCDNGWLWLICLLLSFCVLSYSFVLIEKRVRYGSELAPHAFNSTSEVSKFRSSQSCFSLSVSAPERSDSRLAEKVLLLFVPGGLTRPSELSGAFA